MANVDVNSLSRAELAELRTRIDQAIASSTERDRQRALQAAEEAVRGYGLTLAELAGSSGTGRGIRESRVQSDECEPVSVPAGA